MLWAYTDNIDNYKTRVLFSRNALWNDYSFTQTDQISHYVLNNFCWMVLIGKKWLIDTFSKMFIYTTRNKIEYDSNYYL